MVQKTSLYILDCLFSVLIVGTLVVFVWRGAWILLDIFIFPDNEIWSSWTSLVRFYYFISPKQYSTKIKQNWRIMLEITTMIH